MKFKKEFTYKGKKFIVTTKYAFDCFIQYRIYQKRREKKHWFDFWYKSLIISSSTTSRQTWESFKKILLYDINEYYQNLQDATNLEEWFKDDQNFKF